MHAARCEGSPPTAIDSGLASAHGVDRRRAAGAKAAAAGRVGRAGEVAGEHEACPPGPGTDENRAAVYGWAGCCQSSMRRLLDDPPEVHDDHAVGEVLDDAEVVGDEEVGDAEVALQLDEEVEHLGLDALVQRRHRLVADDELRVGGERAGDRYALELAAGELVGEASA